MNGFSTRIVRFQFSLNPPFPHPVKREQVAEYKKVRGVFNSALDDMNGCVRKKLYEPFELADPAGATAQKMTLRSHLYFSELRPGHCAQSDPVQHVHLLHRVREPLRQAVRGGAGQEGGDARDLAQSARGEL